MIAPSPFRPGRSQADPLRDLTELCLVVLDDRQTALVYLQAIADFGRHCLAERQGWFAVTGEFITRYLLEVNKQAGDERAELHADALRMVYTYLQVEHDLPNNPGSFI